MNVNELVSDEQLEIALLLFRDGGRTVGDLLESIRLAKDKEATWGTDDET